MINVLTKVTVVIILQHRHIKITILCTLNLHKVICHYISKKLENHKVTFKNSETTLQVYYKWTIKGRLSVESKVLIVGMGCTDKQGEQDRNDPCGK